MMIEQYWSCPNCKNKVRESVYPCPNCEDHENVPSMLQKSKSGKTKCPTCTFYNDPLMFQCQICETKLRQEERPPFKLAPHKSTIECPHCHKENDLQNELCLYCEEGLFEDKKNQCGICHQKVKSSLFDGHYEQCLMTFELLQQERQEEERMALIQKEEEERRKKLNLEECVYCHVAFSPSQMKSHVNNCIKKGVVELEVDQKTRMTKLQLEAIHYMHKKSQNEHNSVKSALQTRIKKLGYTIQDLNNLQFYVQNYAPIIVHIHVSKHMQFFIKDTHYRSQFQTNKSSGSLSRPSRIQWQDRMFDKHYSKAKDFERVKYGVINFTNDPKGVACATGYGGSYFLLKEHVRQRCTFTDKDSSSSDAAIATLKYCFKILSKMNDPQLKAAFNASKALEVSSSCTTTYKELQIHGPLQFSKDIERIYVNKNQVKGNKNLTDMVYEFSKKNKVDYDFF